MKILSLLTLGCLLTAPALAQTTPDSATAAAVSFYGFADAYFGYDFGPKSLTRPAFLYAHNRADEFAVNNAIVGVRYQDERVRGAVGLHAGTYVDANYAAEPPVLRHLYEAWAGFRPANRLWLDAGIFASHIGFESAVSKDNWTLTRSLMAENSPYYESGARLTWEASGRLTVTGLVLNGWQNLRDNNRAKALGWQVQWKPTDRLTLNSSSFYGNEQPQDSARRRRFFHDAYVSYALTDRLAVAAVFDVGAQERAPGEGGYDVWHTGAAFVRYQLAAKWWAALRGEYYSAQRGVFIVAGAPRRGDADFGVGGASLNFDYAPTPRVLVRVEGRTLQSGQRRFLDAAGQPVKGYANATGSVAFSF